MWALDNPRAPAKAIAAAFVDLLWTASRTDSTRPPTDTERRTDGWRVGQPFVT